MNQITSIEDTINDRLLLVKYFYFAENFILGGIYKPDSTILKRYNSTMEFEKKNQNNSKHVKVKIMQLN